MWQEIRSKLNTIAPSIDFQAPLSVVDKMASGNFSDVTEADIVFNARIEYRSRYVTLPWEHFRWF